MPITPLHPVRRLSQEDFAELSYAVMGCLFDIHSKYARLFDENIYKRELASTFPGVETEFPILVTHGTYSKTYYLDALVAEGGPFEFKAASTLSSKHRGQLYNYLLLLDLAHGKLVNLRPENVEHEFVNARLRSDERRVFDLITDRWDCSVPGNNVILDSLVSVLRDWGTGLELSLYESVVTHFLGGEDAVFCNVAVQGSRQPLGYQQMRLAAPRVAFRLTAFDAEPCYYEEHARRLLVHTDLQAILWINIGLHEVKFVTIR
jgi:GxxExxY protein